jgi:hypothetical protein
VDSREEPDECRTPVAPPPGRAGTPAATLAAVTSHLHNVPE